VNALVGRDTGFDGGTCARIKGPLSSSTAAGARRGMKDSLGGRKGHCLTGISRADLEKKKAAWSATGRKRAGRKQGRRWALQSDGKTRNWDRVTSGGNVRAVEKTTRSEGRNSGPAAWKATQQQNTDY